MIKAILSNEILQRITAIDQNRFTVNTVNIPYSTANKLRKNSRKKSAYASNHIEGNPLSEEQSNRAIESDPHHHFLKSEQEIRNYWQALGLLEIKARKKESFSEKLILEIQALVEKGAPQEKIGYRKPTPPEVLFAVYDEPGGSIDYIPPENTAIPELVKELVDYVNTTQDHPLIVAAIVHYQMVTIHPFEGGNGRTARLLSGYILDLNGYSFNGLGSLEEYFAYDADEYYSSLQMGLPALYYSGRNDPPHPEIWTNYFLRMVELYSSSICQLSKESEKADLYAGISYLKPKERELLDYLIRKHYYEFAPAEICKPLGVTNRTIINRCARLSETGFLVPNIVRERIRTWQLSEMTRSNEKKILKILEERDYEYATASSGSSKTAKAQES